MNTAYLWLLIPVLVLIVLSGLFSASETAFSSANKIRLRTMHSDGNAKAGKVLKLLDRFDSILTTVLIGNNIVNITMTTLATLLFVEMLQDEALGSIISTVIITVTVLLFGEITPKMIARSNPEKSALGFYSFIRVVEIILYPLNAAFRAWKKMLTKVFKLQAAHGITEDELVTYVETAEDEGGLLAHESTLIKNAIEFDDLEIRDIMVPRVSVLAFSDTASPDEVADLFISSGFSRLPIYHGTIDSVIGFIHEKDFNARYYGKNGASNFSLMSLVKPVACVSPTMKVSLVLRILQRKKQHLAVVVDEFGGTAGIVTMEDILEELVGEIWDEHDEVEELFQKSGGDEYIVNGFANIDDVLAQLDVDEDDFDTTTVGGWVIEQLGKIPVVGSKFSYENIDVTVTKANARRVLEVKMHVNPPKSDDE